MSIKLPLNKALRISSLNDVISMSRMDSQSVKG